MSTSLSNQLVGTEEGRLKIRALVELSRLGWTVSDLCRLTGLSERQVKRYRAVGREVIAAARNSRGELQEDNRNASSS